MITNNIKYHQKGSGLLTRDKGKYPPSMRKNLENYGNEKVNEITIFRYPLTTVTKAAKFFSGGRVPYDDLFHLGIRINNTFNLDKDAVLSFEKEGLRTSKKGFEKMDLGMPSKNMTINELLDKTKKRVGEERFMKYNALTTNCQLFTKDILTTLGMYSNDVKDFVYQDLSQLQEDLPGYAKPITDGINFIKEVWDRQMQGEGSSKKKMKHTNLIF